MLHAARHDLIGHRAHVVRTEFKVDDVHAWKYSAALPEAPYSAPIARANDVIFVAEGYPRTQAMLRDAGDALETLAMSEYAKLDGGLNCLSLRF